MMELAALMALGVLGTDLYLNDPSNEGLKSPTPKLMGRIEKKVEKNMNKTAAKEEKQLQKQLQCDPNTIQKPVVADIPAEYQLEIYNTLQLSGSERKIKNPNWNPNSVMNGIPDTCKTIADG